MEKEELMIVKDRVNEFISTNKKRYELFSSLQNQLNVISKESFPEIINVIQNNTSIFFKDRSTTILFIRTIIRSAKYNLKQMELILDICVHFSSDFLKQTVTETDLIELSENVLNPINYLFDQKVISIDSIISKSIYNDEIFINFFPEIEKTDPEYSKIREKKLLNNFNNKTNYEKVESFYKLVKSNQSLHIFNRSLNYHPLLLHKSIREDDIDTFQSILSRNNLSVNHRIEYSVYERSHTPDKEMSLIQIAAIYGSLQIFKFLWLQKGIKFDENLQRYANYGNNYEIIHMLELNCSYKNIIDDLIAFNRHELLNYFLENYGNEKEEKAIQNKLEKFVDENEISKSLNYQNLICAVSFSNIPIILSCLQKIVFIVKYIEKSKVSSILNRSQFDFELFKFLFSFISKDSLTSISLFFYSIKINAFDSFQFLFQILLDKIDVFQLFVQCLKLNYKLVNYILDSHNMKINEYSTVFSVLKSKISFNELALALEYYNEDIVVKIIDLFHLLDYSQNQEQFIILTTENLSSIMILSLFKKLIKVLAKEILNSMIEFLNLYEMFDVCELIFDTFQIENKNIQ